MAGRCRLLTESRQWLVQAPRELPCVDFTLWFTEQGKGGPGSSSQGVKLLWSWAMVMGQWDAGRLGCSGPFLRTSRQRARGPWWRTRPLPSGNSDLWPKGTYLQADLGRVQWEGEEVGEAGRGARPQKLHSRRGRHLGRLQAHHVPGALPGPPGPSREVPGELPGLGFRAGEAAGAEPRSPGFWDGPPAPAAPAGDWPCPVDSTCKNGAFLP